jgi:uncharacterized protein
VTRTQAIILGITVLALLGVTSVWLLQSHGKGRAKLPAPMLLVLRITLGIVFIILGIIGGFVPIMQGWIFMLLAVLVLFPQSKFAIKSLDKIEVKAPRIVAWLRRLGIGVHKE